MKFKDLTIEQITDIIHEVFIIHYKEIVDLKISYLTRDGVTLWEAYFYYKRDKYYFVLFPSLNMALRKVETNESVLMQRQNKIQTWFNEIGLKAEYE